MTQIVAGVSKAALVPAAGIFSSIRAHLGSRTSSRDIIILGFMLAILQILDGVLTGIGVRLYGTSAEGNLFLRHLMEAWGTTPALCVTKGCAVLIVASLCVIAHRRTWVTQALRGIVLLYTGAAILPWSWILIKVL